MKSDLLKKYLLMEQEPEIPYASDYVKPEIQQENIEPEMTEQTLKVEPEIEVPKETGPYDKIREALTGKIQETIPKLTEDEEVSPEKEALRQKAYSEAMQGRQLSPEEDMLKQKYMQSLLSPEQPDTSNITEMLEKYKTLQEKQLKDMDLAQKKDSETLQKDKIMSAGRRINESLAGTKLGEYKMSPRDAVKNLKDKQSLESKSLDKENQLKKELDKKLKEGQISPEQYSQGINILRNLRKDEEPNINELAKVSSLYDDQDPTKKLNSLASILNALPKGPKEATAIQKKRMANYDRLKKEKDEDQQYQRDKEKRSAYLSAADKLKKDERYKIAYKESLSFDQVDKLLEASEKGNATAFSSVGTKMAKAMGEVGVLTENDVKRYVDTQQLSRKAANKLSLMMKGSPVKPTVDEIKQIVNIMKETHKSKLQPIFDDYAGRMYTNFPDQSREEAYTRLSLPVPTKFKKAKKSYETNLKKNKEKLEEMGIKNARDWEDFLIEQGKL